MDRRKSLKLSFVVIITCFLAGSFFWWPSIAVATLNRLDKWAPPNDFKIRVYWRYVAGRIVDDDQDFGFIVSISDVKAAGIQANTLTVQRQDFEDDQEFVGKTYTGTLIYDDVSATYIFKDGADQELVTWQWDEGAQVYSLTVATTELTLTNIIMLPQGELIPEGGDGDIKVGRLGTIMIDSDYYADWTTIEVGGEEKGVARVDMQGLRNAGISAQASTDYDHHWFVAAVDLDDGSPAWISAWQIEDPDGPFWDVTIARNSGATWNVFSLTEDDEASMAQPLAVTAISWQNLPASTGLAQSTGKKWHLTAGNSQPNDLLDLQISVLPGQFITSDVQTTSDWLQEAVGIQVEGTISGTQISSVKMAAAESSTEFNFTAPDSNLIFLPLIFK